MANKRTRSSFIVVGRKKGARGNCFKRNKDPDSDTETYTDSEDVVIKSGARPQIELLLRRAPYYRNSIPLPYEMLMKIFKYVVEQSDHPIRDLCNLARVCETWRRIIVESPALWSRIDISQLPITEGNVSTLRKIFESSPSILEHVTEVCMSGELSCKETRTMSFIESLILAPNLTTLSFRALKPHNRTSLPSILARSINQCKKLQNLSITDSRLLFHNQKWLTDHLMANGQHLEVLNLAMSLTSISSQLFKAIGSDFCPNLRVLDISTYDSLNTHSFDALQLSQSTPSLEVLRVGNVSFKRVHNSPEKFGLTKLRELSMPIGKRDADRDDVLFATLTFGSEQVTTLDLRGSSMSAYTLIEMPSFNVRELHMDDLCPITRREYHRVIEKWAHSLQVLSLIRINCSETVKSCLEALCNQPSSTHIRELDLTGSDVTKADLKRFLACARKTLNSVNLSSCRSLPRGCKGHFTLDPIDRSSLDLMLLKKRLN